MRARSTTGAHLRLKSDHRGFQERNLYAGFAAACAPAVAAACAPAQMYGHVSPNVSPLDHFEAILTTGVLQPVRACAYGCVRARLEG